MSTPLTSLPRKLVVQLPPTSIVRQMTFDTSGPKLRAIPVRNAVASASGIQADCVCFTTAMSPSVPIAELIAQVEQGAPGSRIVARVVEAERDWGEVIEYRRSTPKPRPKRVSPPPAKRAGAAKAGSRKRKNTKKRSAAAMMSSMTSSDEAMGCSDVDDDIVVPSSKARAPLSPALADFDITVATMGYVQPLPPVTIRHAPVYAKDPQSFVLVHASDSDVGDADEELLDMGEQSDDDSVAMFDGEHDSDEDDDGKWYDEDESGDDDCDDASCPSPVPPPLSPVSSSSGVTAGREIRPASPVPGSVGVGADNQPSSPVDSPPSSPVSTDSDIIAVEVLSSATVHKIISDALAPIVETISAPAGGNDCEPGPVPMDIEETTAAVPSDTVAPASLASEPEPMSLVSPVEQTLVATTTAVVVQPESLPIPAKDEGEFAGMLTDNVQPVPATPLGVASMYASGVELEPIDAAEAWNAFIQSLDAEM